MRSVLILPEHKCSTVFVFPAIPSYCSQSSSIVLAIHTCMLTHPLNFPCGRKPITWRKPTTLGKSVDKLVQHAIRCLIKGSNPQPEWWEAVSQTSEPPKPLIYKKRLQSAINSHIVSDHIHAQCTNRQIEHNTAEIQLLLYYSHNLMYSCMYCIIG